VLRNGEAWTFRFPVPSIVCFRDQLRSAPTPVLLIG
jgi:hypothetical protein